jgi:putative FmdB family regulatory protein
MHPYNECISFAVGGWPVPKRVALFRRFVMPIFEYICKGCGKKFEAIVYGSKKSECPACKSIELEQQLSTFAAHGTDKSSGTAPKMPCGMPAGSCGGGGCGMN